MKKIFFIVLILISLVNSATRIQGADTVVSSVQISKVTLVSEVTAGNFLFAGIAGVNVIAAGRGVSVSDNLGNTWTLADSGFEGTYSSQKNAAWSCISEYSGLDTFTVTILTENNWNYAALFFEEWSGVTNTKVDSYFKFRTLATGTDGTLFDSLYQSTNNQLVIGFALSTVVTADISEGTGFTLGNTATTSGGEAILEYSTGFSGDSIPGQMNSNEASVWGITGLFASFELSGACDTPSITAKKFTLTCHTKDTIGHVATGVPANIDSIKLSGTIPDSMTMKAYASSDSIIMNPLRKIANTTFDIKWWANNACDSGVVTDTVTWIWDSVHIDSIMRKDAGAFGRVHQPDTIYAGDTIRYCGYWRGLRGIDSLFFADSNHAALTSTDTTTDFVLKNNITEGFFRPSIEDTVSSDTAADSVYVLNEAPATTYTLTYNGNGATGGSPPAQVSYAEGATITTAGNTGSLTNTGYTFNGWNDQADGEGTTRAVGSTWSMPAAAVTLYAQWSEILYPPTITLNPVQDHDTIGGTDTAFVTVTGTTPFSRKWQFHTGGSWVDTAVDYDSLFYPLSHDKDGDSVRFIVTNSEGADTSAAYRITITHSIAITKHPAGYRGAAQTAYYDTVNASGTVTAWQWQIRANGSATWRDTATTRFLAFDSVTTAINGSYIRAYARNTLPDTVYTNSARILKSSGGGSGGGGRWRGWRDF
jgi:uncharacterized repeat protein (TIGR02543 family)